MKVKKAVIPAAGLGTRFLPATKALPKEMLPVVDKPTIQYIVEEAIASGIEDILIISGRGKRAIEDHFDVSYELEQTLERTEKWDRLEEVKKISNMASIHYVRQKEPRGLGHAIACASTFIGNEPFAVMLGDDIVRSDVPCLKQLMNIYEEEERSVLGVQQVPEHRVSSYGIVSPQSDIDESGTVPVRDLVEKPGLEEAPSNLAIMGRYVLTPEIMPILKTLPPGAGNEIQLTDGIRKLINDQDVLAYHFEGTRYDVGDKFGFLQATIDFALEREDYRSDLTSYIRELNL
ncbi:UTP-glucose-1-phosphate uridylyltransferase [Geomicrobium sp. JCM 19037]|uniref:UTP--glucose-1-phosphate uridylyltransferase GalU n=1 Tax=unclassified Geomicrobium TaxID=2628951 RepID=UPI00045F4956|nr:MULTISPECIES: UTP--glucose-1-phosphate uridylyltransferase GalU [unclassified Geomicrobium]GAK02545.1 UTP-glucose-1-phosphate uridylyltransferase [Geomicrobium sp. JCM 19037]GAK11591.1 UTP-glucose-1-phosphate uridylyltransferase [Geomicrobium sp. JCM 19039]